MPPLQHQRQRLPARLCRASVCRPPDLSRRPQVFPGTTTSPKTIPRRSRSSFPLPRRPTRSLLCLVRGVLHLARTRTSTLLRPFTIPGPSRRRAQSLLQTRSTSKRTLFTMETATSPRSSRLPGVTLPSVPPTSVKNWMFLRPTLQISLLVQSLSSRLLRSTNSTPMLFRETT